MNRSDERNGRDELTDFRILQRDADGYARYTWSGILENDLPDNGSYVAVRVVREDDSLNAIFWTPCRMSERCWSADLVIPEGGLYRFEAAVRNGLNLWLDRIKCVYHVGVGDIYVTAGQSNMTGYGRDSAYDPPCLGVHALTNRGNWSIAAHPLSDALGSVFGCPENAAGTSPALSFARRLHDRLGVPVGILPAAVGGTPLAAWNPEEEGSCWREMCSRIDRTGSFKGFIWFQGCSDANQKDAAGYFGRFCRMTALWREKFGPHPVLTVQLNRWTGTPDGANDIFWGQIRDAQRRAALEAEDVYVVPSIDLPVTDGIHNSSGANVIIGERLANTALACVYGKPGQTAAAVIGAEQTDESHLLLRLTPGRHVFAMDNRADGMNVEDRSGLTDCTEAVATEDGLLVTTARPYTLPAEFHYAWRTRPPVFPVRDFYDMPLLSCYGVKIGEKA